jgi:hypothetical protein
MPERFAIRSIIPSNLQPVGSGWNIWRNAGGRIAPISTHGYGGGD